MDMSLELQFAQFYYENNITPPQSMAIKLSEKHKNQQLPPSHCDICGQQFTHTQQDQILSCCICHCQVHAECDKILNVSLIDRDSYKCPHCRQLYLEKHPYWLNNAVCVDPSIDMVEKPKRRVKQGNISRSTPVSNTQTDVNNQIPTLQIQRPLSQQKPTFKYSEDDIKSLENWLECPIHVCHESSNHKKIFSDTTNTSCLTYVNNIFNNVKINTAILFQSLQKNVKKELDNKQDLYRPIDLQKDDVNVFNIQSVLVDNYSNYDQNKKMNFLRQLNLQQTQFSKWQQISPIILQDKLYRYQCSVVLVKSLYEYTEQLRIQYLSTLIPGIVQTVAFLNKNQTIPIETAIGLSSEGIKQVTRAQIENNYLQPQKLFQQLNKQDEIYQLVKTNFCQGSYLTSRQIYDLKERGFEFYPYCALIRQSLLLAIVNVSLGQNALEKQLTGAGVDILIKFGYESLIEYTEQQAKYLSSQTYLGEEMITRTDTNQNYEIYAKDEMLFQDQEQMKDFDILETPQSVLMIMICIGNILKANKFI